MQVDLENSVLFSIIGDTATILSTAKVWIYQKIIVTTIYTTKYVLSSIIFNFGVRSHNEDALSETH
jgi:hypothetical protein